MNQKKSTLADSDKPYKYRTGKQTTSEEDNDKEKMMSKSQKELLSESVQDFITDSLWQATLKPDVHTVKEEKEEEEDYRSDMLYMTESTTSSEVVDFLTRCIENPVTIDDNIVWNFSTHTIKDEAIEEIGSKEQGKFIIPYQVTGAWGFMFSLLPQEIREAEILVYNSSDEEYKAYRSLYRTTPNERMSQIQQDLSRRLVRESGEDIGLTK
jgi:hypothetical protein